MADIRKEQHSSISAVSFLQFVFPLHVNNTISMGSLIETQTCKQEYGSAVWLRVRSESSNYKLGRLDKKKQ